MDYNISRFLDAQKYDYDIALREIRGGRKRSHWIWYIFPQLKGLGFSRMSDYYGIDGLGEAKAYLSEPVLRQRLEEITGALLELESSDAGAVMGYPDDLKLKSSMTLFCIADPDQPLYRKVLEKYFDGKMDEKTLKILKMRE